MVERSMGCCFCNYWNMFNSVDVCVSTFGWSYVTTGWLYVNIGCLIKSISSGFLELRCFSQECYRLLKAVPIAKPAGCLEIASCGTYLDLEMALFSAPTLFGRICAHSGFLWSLDWKMCICALMDGHRRFFPGIYARKCAPWIFAWKRTKWKNVNSGAITLLWGKNRSSSIFSSNENWSALFPIVHVWLTMSIHDSRLIQGQVPIWLY